MKSYRSPKIDEMTDIFLGGNVVSLSSVLSKRETLVKEFGSGPVDEFFGTLVVIPEKRLRDIIRHLVKVGIFIDLSPLSEEISEEEMNEFDRDFNDAERELRETEKSVSERILDEFLSSMNLGTEDDKKQD